MVRAFYSDPHCLNLLAVPGAVLISPPADARLVAASVLKYHLCVRCWERLIDRLRAQDL